MDYFKYSFKEKRLPFILCNFKYIINIYIIIFFRILLNYTTPILNIRLLFILKKHQILSKIVKYKVNQTFYENSLQSLFLLISKIPKFILR